MQAGTHSAKVSRLVNKADKAKDDEVQPADNVADAPSTGYKQLTPNNILRLQTTIGNQAVMRLLARRSTPLPNSLTTFSPIRRQLDLVNIGSSWSATEKNKYEPTFARLEEVIGILKGKPEADVKKFKDLVTIFNKYNDKPTKKSTAVIEDLNKIVAGQDYINGLAAKYVKAEPVKESSESDESEGEDDTYDLTALAGGSATGKKILAEQAEQSKAEKLKEEADKGAQEREEYYAGFNQKTARAKLTEWVDAEAVRMIGEINEKFDAVPDTYGSVYYTQPDSRLVGIANLTASDLYGRIAAKVKAAFPDGSASHKKGFNYHHTKVTTKGAGGFNITGWTKNHEVTDKSPFNLHVVHH